MAGGDTSFPRSERIHQRPDFERAYEQGIRISGRFMTVFMIANGRTAPRLGVAATSKAGLGRRTQSREAVGPELFRRHKLPVALDIVIVPRRDMLDAPFASLESDYDRALLRRDERRGSRPPVGRGPRRTRGAPRV
jgi:ribonuclease P protein component